MISNSPTKQCALPSIRSLLLDMPGYAGYHQANYLPQSNFSPPPPANYSLPPLHRLAPYSFGAPPPPPPASSVSSSAGPAPIVPKAPLAKGGEYHAASAQLVSPITSPYRVHSVDPVGSAHGRERASSDPIIDVLSPATNISQGSVDDMTHDIAVSAAPSLAQLGGLGYVARGSDSAVTKAGLFPAVEPTTIKKNWKPRKKRQCPECKLFYSNLATHKSTHLQPTSRPHICKYCSRGFARPNDLFRHVKCHWKEIGSDKGQFKCPFKVTQEQTPPSSEDEASDHCCHNTGIFSRCDTFKNHLKAIHFQYPNGTKKDQRMKVRGKCRMCQEEFVNVDEWLSKHIDGNRCPAVVNKA